MISEKDLNAIAEIIKVNLRETYWLNLLVNSLSDYFVREYDMDMSLFKKTCLNGDAETKEDVLVQPPVESKLDKEIPDDLGGPISINRHLREAEEALQRLPELIQKGKS